ncbi:NAD(P)-dependent oxidoreductase [Rhodobacteraceae bacterium]|nr:NAD(P)-dependent oxidoreductase [Paracoccaceae bacterium]|tara:strand:- start:949 stop:1848 length:900 start_codon:yes stop_codon:yes gene_type:complete
MMRIGFVGLGIMGKPMASCLVSSGKYRVIGYDISIENMEAAAELGVDKHAGSLRELAENTDLIILMLPNGDIVKNVVLGGDREGLINGLKRGSTILDMSSVSPFQTQELSKILAADGIMLVDAPVSGNVTRARTGQLAVMAGGDAEAIEYVRGPLSAMSRQITHVGPVGSGHAIKSLNNLLSASGLIAAGEVLLIGKKFGLDSQIMLDVLNASTGRNNSTENKIGQFVLSRKFDSGFALNLMAKDVAIALDVANRCGVPSRHSVLTREMVDAANSEEGAGSDHTALIRWLESLSGLELD